MRIPLSCLMVLLCIAPAMAGDIKWNDPPAPAGISEPVEVEISPMPDVATVAPSSGDTAPAAKAATVVPAAGVTTFKKSVIVDDAPPPRRAPKRGQVNVLSLPAPFGIIENSVIPARPRYAPAMVQRAVPKAPVAKPLAKPNAPADGQFVLRFSKLRIEVSDAMSRWQNAALPVSLGPNLAVFLQSIAVTVQQQPLARLEVRAYSTQGGWQSEARRHSLARALAVYQWLVDQGIRPTQIDWYALGQPGDGGEADRVDIVLKPPQ